MFLDGLDEVKGGEYASVLESIRQFCAAEEPSIPTARSRVILSCRAQNFYAIRGDWIPRFASDEFVLAPFRDAEIYSFLRARRDDFSGDRTPERFYKAVLSSETVQLHRYPLILTISLGMYLNLSAYEIPQSIGRFYSSMVDELLRRHDFRIDETTPGINKFSSDDKERYLRNFALDTVVTRDGFEDFTLGDLIQYAKDMANSMANVPEKDAEAFVREIIDSSGLINSSNNRRQCPICNLYFRV